MKRERNQWKGVGEDMMTKMVENTVQREFDASCPHCGSTSVYGVSRVVGYFAKINNWNVGKRVEFRDRQKGDYAIRE